MHRAVHGGDLAAAVGCHDGIGCEQLHDFSAIAFRSDGHEALQHASSGRIVDLKASAFGSHALPGAMHQLSARRFALAQRLRDVNVVIVQYVMQHERRALLRGECFE
jgi:hypothetical protein